MSAFAGGLVEGNLLHDEVRGILLDPSSDSLRRSRQEGRIRRLGDHRPSPPRKEGPLFSVVPAQLNFRLRVSK